MSTKAPTPSAFPLPKTARVAIAAARFNADLVDTLLEGCLDRLKELGLPIKRITVVRVPGAFELPLAAQALARTKQYSAVIALGAIIRGETPHFEYVSSNCSQGLSRVSLDHNLPVIFGVLTTNTEPQAWARAGGKHSHAGRQSADAAAEMIHLLSSLKKHP